MSIYIASKTGLMGFGKALQQESIRLGIRTVLFYPGRINSNFRGGRKNMCYMSPDHVAQSIISVLSLPNDIIPYEFIFRPKGDINI